MKALERSAGVDLPFPQQCVVELTAGCDQQCIYCGRNVMERPRKTMGLDLFKKIADEVAQENPYCEIWPTFMGEALLLGDKVFEAIRYARAAGCQKLTLNSNGNRLTDENIDGILTCGLDRFILSCDGHSKETYEKVRRGGRFERLYGGANRLVEEYHRRGLTRPMLEMQFSIFDENQHEAEEFKRYWLSRGAVVKTRPKLFWSGSVEGGDHRVTTHAADREPCLWSFDTVGIHWNGSVVMCAVDCEGKYVAGNVQFQSLKEIWNGPLKFMRHLQAQQRYSELPEICRKCTDWKVKKAHAFFPSDEVRERYEAYVRTGRVFFQEHQLAPSDHSLDFTVDGEDLSLRAGAAR